MGPGTIILLLIAFFVVFIIAKGVRKMSSSKRSLLEPGNQVRAFVIPTASLAIITQKCIRIFTY